MRSRGEIEETNEKNEVEESIEQMKNEEESTSLESKEKNDCQILYHPGKANVVADALSRKSMGSLAHISVHKRSIVKELRDLFDMGVQFEVTEF